MLTKHNHPRLLGLLALVMGLVLGGVAFLESGWRIGPAGLTRVGRARICVEAPRAGSTLFVDERRVGASRTPHQELCETLERGEHTLLLSAPGAWPWWKAVIVGGSSRTYRAFALPQETEKVELKAGTDQYIRAQNALVVSPSPTDGSPVRSADGSLAVWFDKGERALRARWSAEREARPIGFCEGECTDDITILSNITEDVRSLALAPGRNDVVLIAVGSGIFALEITAAPSPNFQPVYTGTGPIFLVHDAKTLYVGDGSRICAVNIEHGL